jgi:hypothetical protein
MYILRTSNAIQIYRYVVIHRVVKETLSELYEMHTVLQQLQAFRGIYHDTIMVTTEY